MARERPAATAAAQAPSRDLLDKYCVRCHSARLKTANLVLENLNLADMTANAPVLEKVITKLRVDQMPPAGNPRPDAASKAAFLSALEAAIDGAAQETPNPGYVTAHRISRNEYVNAVRDLLALDVDGTALLPADSAGVGFDTDSAVLKVTPALMSRYVSAATKISRLAMGSAELRPVVYVHRASEYLRQETRVSEDQPFGTKGGFAFRYAFPLDGEYAFKLRLTRANAYRVIRGLSDDLDIEVRLDRALVRQFTIEARYAGHDYSVLVAPTEIDVEGKRLHEYRSNADNDLEFRIPVKAGTRLVSAAFIGTPDVFERVPVHPRSFKLFQNEQSETPGIDTIQISGPLGGQVPIDSETRRRIFVCRPVTTKDEEPCAERIIRTLVRRAYRRPVTAGDVTSLLAFYQRGRAAGNFDGGIERTLEALLASPHFLLRAEHQSARTGPDASRRVSDIELASRLSFFLWSSIPDDRLLSLAEQGRLSAPVVLEREVRRMLTDQRATAFVRNFTNQWLITRNARSHELDPDIFPDIDDNLQEAISRETELFLESQVREDRGALDLLKADYTFLNERLARHYGIPGVYGDHFRRVPLTDDRRFGLLGKGSVHMVTAYANRTSVVLRGKWILEYMLDAPPAPPPANVPNLQDNDPRKPTSLRERMEQHRRNPVCASCHNAMDPLGFALENFDASGRWRTADNGVPLDTVGVLPDGSKLDGLPGLRTFLTEQRADVFVRTVVKKLLGYAVRREVEYYDMPTVRQIIRETARNKYRWSSLIAGVVRSPAFQMRRLPASEAASAEHRLETGRMEGKAR